MTAFAEWQLWGTTVRLVVTNPRLLDRATAIADRELAAIDEASNTLRPDSELCRIAHLLPDGVEVSDTLAMLVRRALIAAELTGGDVDPTTALQPDISSRHGWRGVTLVGRRLTVPAPLALDLGATAGAVAADLTAARIARELGCGVLLRLGDDVAAAGASPAGGWAVPVNDLPETWVRLPSRHALATSSSRETLTWRSVTVAAPTCALANTLSAAAIARGVDAIGFLEEFGMGARLVDSYGRVVETTGWPSERVLAHAG